jgi:hypothetical protein
MSAFTGVAEAIFEATVFLNYYKDMPDHRQAGKVAYRLDEILLLARLSIMAGSEGFTDMALFGQKKLPLLRRFLPFANGTPTNAGDQSYARLERTTEPCRVGFQVDEEQSCPLYQTDISIENLKNFFAIATRVLRFWTPATSRRQTAKPD